MDTNFNIIRPIHLKPKPDKYEELHYNNINEGKCVQYWTIGCLLFCGCGLCIFGSLSKRKAQGHNTQKCWLWA